MQRQIIIIQFHNLKQFTSQLHLFPFLPSLLLFILLQIYHYLPLFLEHYFCQFIYLYLIKFIQFNFIYIAFVNTNTFLLHHLIKNLLVDLFILFILQYYNYIIFLFNESNFLMQHLTFNMQIQLYHISYSTIFHYQTNILDDHDNTNFLHIFLYYKSNSKLYLPHLIFSNIFNI